MPFKPNWTPRFYTNWRYKDTIIKIAIKYDREVVFIIETVWHKISWMVLKSHSTQQSSSLLSSFWYVCLSSWNNQCLLAFDYKFADSFSTLYSQSIGSRARHLSKNEYEWLIVINRYGFGWFNDSSTQIVTNRVQKWWVRWQASGLISAWFDQTLNLSNFMNGSVVHNKMAPPSCQIDPKYPWYQPKTSGNVHYEYQL